MLLLLLTGLSAGAATPEIVETHGNVMDGFAQIHFAPLDVAAADFLVGIDSTPLGGLHEIKRIDAGVF